MGEAREELAAIVVGLADRVGEGGGGVEELRVARSYSRAYGEERQRRDGELVAVPVRVRLPLPELPDHEADRCDEVLERPVRPVEMGPGRPGDDHVLAHEVSTRALRQDPDLLGGCERGGEDVRLDGGGLGERPHPVHGPAGQAVPDRGGEVGAVGGGRLHVCGGRGGGGALPDDAQRPRRQRQGLHGRVTGHSVSEPLPAVKSGPQFHDAHTLPVSRYAASAVLSTWPSASVNHSSGSGP